MTKQKRVDCVCSRKYNLFRLFKSLNLGQRGRDAGQRQSRFEQRFSSLAYPLETNDNMYVCPTCVAKTASVRSLRPHMDRHRDRTQEERLSEWENPERRIDDTETWLHGAISPISARWRTWGSCEATWKVAICTRCKFGVDTALPIYHLKLKHGLDNLNEDAISQAPNTLFDLILQLYGKKQPRTR
ncbi:hypothetical protein V1515DRAFT_368960 [Lipomyces mesembrius]